MNAYKSSRHGLAHRPTFHSVRRVFFGSLAALALPVSAYPYNDTLPDAAGSGQLDGTDSRTVGVVQTYNIPITDWPDLIDFRAIGGDGGRARATSTFQGTETGDGGGGAQIIATFHIHPDEENALRPGGELRMIVGNRGSNETRSSVAGGGGGGSTAVLYRPPVDGATWGILIAAGGGGGGYADIPDASGDGKNAETETSGSSGGGGSGSGGIDGGAGESINGAGGGGGVYGAATGDEGGGKGTANGAAGGNATGGSGGFGFTGGGSGASSNFVAQGGGGGGFSGGGGGNNSKQGGGGGSVLDYRADPASSITSRNGSADPGEIAFTANKNSSNGNLNGPTTNLIGVSPVYLIVGDPYTEQGLTATDVYGNGITLDSSNYLVSDNVNTSSAGTYTVLYTVTDQFGNISNTTRSVIVEDENAPTFDIGGNLTRLAGSRTDPSFATNFDANNDEQSFSHFTVTNDNNALFSVQPSCDTSGNLTFTVPNGNYGSANCTITGFDTGASNNSSSQNFVITITQNDPVAAFSLDRSVTVQGTALSFTDTSSWANSWAWDFDNDGNIDSTAQNPTFAFTTAGTKTVKLTVTNTEGSDIVTQTIEVIGSGFVNGDFSSTTLDNGSGNGDSLGTGWYASNGDNGSVATPDWSAGETVGTPGVLTQTSNNGAATRFGQLLGIDLDGSDWALAFDLNGSLNRVRIYAGTLATSPTGTVLRGDDTTPNPNLVNGAGWTSVLYETNVSATGNVVFDINANLSNYNVLAIQIRGNRDTVGTTYDNFQLIQPGVTAVDDSFATDANETVSGNALINDIIVPAGSATVGSMEGSAGNIGTEVTLPSGARVTMESDGTFTYDPNDAFDGLDENTDATDTFTYTISYDTYSSTGTVTVNITQTAPAASFTLDETVTVTGTALSFTDTSSRGDSWEWDFDNDGNTDSTDRDPVHAYATAGTKTVKLTVGNGVGSDTATKTIKVIAAGLVNGDFSSAPIVSGSGDKNSLGTGWYAKNGDDGTVASPDWSAGETTGTSGILTQMRNSASATRFGQFFGIDLDGTGWVISMDLVGSFSKVRIYAGTLADQPSGEVLRGDDESPETSLVDGNGWTNVLYETDVSGNGTVTLSIDADLSQFNVMAIQFTASGEHVGSTYDNIQLDQLIAEAVDDSYLTDSWGGVGANVLSNDNHALDTIPSVVSVEGLAENVGAQITLPSGALLMVQSDGIFSYNTNDAFSDLPAGATTTDTFAYEMTDGISSSAAMVTVTITGAAYSQWSEEHNYSSFEADDNGDGQANGLDYVFGEVNPVSLSGEGILEAPASVPADVILHLQASTDLNTWTTILTYTDGAISFQDSSVSIVDGVITHTTTGSDVFYRYGASLQE